MKKRILENLVLTDDTYIYDGDLEITGDVRITNGELYVSGELIINNPKSHILFVCSEVGVESLSADTTTVIQAEDSDIYVAGNLDCGGILSNAQISVGGNSDTYGIHCSELFVTGNNESTSIYSTFDIYIGGNSISFSLSARDIFIGGRADLCESSIVARDSLFVGLGITNCSSISVK